MDPVQYPCFNQMDPKTKPDILFPMSYFLLPRRMSLGELYVYFKLPGINHETDPLGMQIAQPRSDDNNDNNDNTHDEDMPELHQTENTVEAAQYGSIIPDLYAYFAKRTKECKHEMAQSELHTDDDELMSEHKPNSKRRINCVEHNNNQSLKKVKI